MIDDLDDFLKKFLIKELSTLGYDPGTVDIVFDQPKREWSARLSRPTLNVFLYDIRENQKLRQTQPTWENRLVEGGRVEQRRKPVRMDLHYLMTAWGTAPEDEHGLLSHAMMALLRYSNLPDDDKMLPLPDSLRTAGKLIPIQVAQYEELPNPTDMWNVLDNEIRPCIVCILTVSFDPFAPVTVSQVRTRELRMGDSAEPASGQFRKVRKPKARTAEEAEKLKAMEVFRKESGLAEEMSTESFWTIGGYLRSSKKIDFGMVRLTLVEQGLVVPVQSDGRFVIGRLKAGKYSLEITADGGPMRRFPISVPSADFEIKI